MNIKYLTKATLICLTSWFFITNAYSIDIHGRSVVMGSDDYAHDVTRTIWSEEFSYVRLMRSDLSSGAGLDHPVNIEPEQLYDLLAGIKVKLKTKPEPLFSEFELDRLAQSVSLALSQAGTDEDVVFAITDSKGSLFIRTELVTTGRLFIQDNKIHIIFKHMNKPFLDAVRGSGYLKAFEIPFRDQNHRPKYDIVQTEMVSVLNPGRPDWQTITLQPIVKHKAALISVEETNQLNIPEQTPVQAENTTDVSTSISRSMESRLTELKALFEKELITEQDYNTKKQELLDEL